MLIRPHNLNDAQLGILILIVIPVLGGLCWFYNSYRLGKLWWKPTRPVNPRLACLIILFGILLTAIILAMLA